MCSLGSLLAHLLNGVECFLIVSTLSLVILGDQGTLLFPISSFEMVDSFGNYTEALVGLSLLLLNVLYLETNKIACIESLLLLQSLYGSKVIR